MHGDGSRRSRRGTQNGCFVASIVKQRTSKTRCQQPLHHDSASTLMAAAFSRSAQRTPFPAKLPRVGDAH